RQEHGDPRSARAGSAIGDQRAERLAGLGKAPTRGERVRDLEPDVVPRAGVLRARIPEPDDQEVGWNGRAPAAAAKEAHLALFAAGTAFGGFAPLALALGSGSLLAFRHLALLADELGFLLDLLFLLDLGRSGDGRDHDLGQLARHFDALGRAHGVERLRLGDPHLADVRDDRVGDVGWKRLDRDLARDVLE